MEGEKMNFDNARKIIGSITDIGMALLALGIVASLLVGPTNLPFVGNVVSNITGLVTQLGSAGLAGLTAAETSKPNIVHTAVLRWIKQRRM